MKGFNDVQLILQTSSDVRAPLPFANIIRDKFIAAIANDLEESGLPRTRSLGCLQVSYVKHYFTPRLSRVPGVW